MKLFHLVPEFSPRFVSPCAKIGKIPCYFYAFKIVHLYLQLCGAASDQSGVFL